MDRLLINPVVSELGSPSESSVEFVSFHVTVSSRSLNEASEQVEQVEAEE